jgi:hypothetical protein
MAKGEAPVVRPRQIWADNDKRLDGRRIRVDSIDGDHANCTITADATPNEKTAGHILRPPGWTNVGRTTRIALHRFRPTSTGYRLISEIRTHQSRDK